MSALARLPAFAQSLDCYTGLDDFRGTIGTGDYTKVVTDSGTIVTGDAANGIVTFLPSDGSVADNDEAYLSDVNESFLPRDGKPMIFGTYLQFAEVATNVANIVFGVANAPAANLIIDDGGGIRASGTLAAIYKVDGETVWRCTSRNGSTAYINQSNTTAGGAAYQYLEIEFVEFDSTQCKVFFRYGTNPSDTKPFIDSTTKLPIWHYMLYASVTEMAKFWGVKNGSAVQQPLLVDNVWFSAKR